MYAPDLTPYRYTDIRWRIWRRSHWPMLMNVGWLSSDHPFPKGEFDDVLLHKLFKLTMEPFVQTKGLHPCPFCNCRWDEEMGGNEAAHFGSKSLLGNAELWVPTSTRIIFAAPTMLFHYIRDHQYLPPREFIEALRTTDLLAIKKLKAMLAAGYG